MDWPISYRHRGDADLPSGPDRRVKSQGIELAAVWTMERSRNFRKAYTDAHFDE